MRRVLSPRWMLLHALALALVVGMLGLGWWQATRAASGNMVSWGYMFQWPVFAGFVVFIWTREVRRVGKDPGTPSRPAAGPVARRPVITRRAAAYGDAGADGDGVTDDGAAGDPELAAYNRYLAWLNAHPQARAVDYPG